MLPKMRTKEENIKELKRLMRLALAAKNRIGDRVFAQGRTPTQEEFAEMDELQTRHDNYGDVLRTYFSTSPDEEYWKKQKEKWPLH